jgi:hypothetical protein
MRNATTIKYALCAGTAALLLAGCGGGRSADGAALSGSAAGAPAQPDSGGEIAANTKDARGSAAGAVRPEQAAQARTGSAEQVKLAPASGRAVVYTADLQVRARNVDAATTRAQQLVSAAGGHVETESTTSEPVGATITFKIPADRYATVLDQLAGRLGTRLSLRQQAEDVTEEVADVDSRVRSAEATLASFRTLLGRARTVGEVISVEQELSQRQADLEALQARQKSLAQQTAFGTVTLRLEAPSTAPAARSSGGFMGGLRSGWAAFTTALGGLAVALGWVLPFLVPLVFLGALAWRLRDPVRRFAGRRRPAQPSATAE